MYPHLSLRRARQAARTLLALACTVCVAPAFAQSTALGAAPFAEVDQDTSTWDERAATKAAATRDDVVALYHDVYLSGGTVALGWNGSVAACNPGTTTVQHQQAVIARANYYRALVGLPAVSLQTDDAAQEHAAALMFAANNALSHSPPTSWTCYTAQGAAGAGTSNIALGSNGVRSIDSYMDDFGVGNEAVGHRRWILYPPQVGMATGDIAGANAPPRPANALKVIGAFGTRPATPRGIAWPPGGYVPYQNLPAQSNRWSFSYPQASFAQATVTMRGPSGTLPVVFEPLSTGYGDNAIVWKPTGVSYAKPPADTPYTVSITGLTGPNVPASVQYVVTAIDPDAAAAPPATVTVVEFYNVALDHYFITWLDTEIANLDAGRTPTRWNRTGKTFKAYASATPGTSPVCRFYIPPGKGDSHFFGRGTTECNSTGQQHPDFILEDATFVSMILPAAGVCPSGTIPVYRVFSNRADANHRYTADRSVRNDMIARGWLAEGDGPDLVVMCGPA